MKRIYLPIIMLLIAGMLSLCGCKAIEGEEEALSETAPAVTEPQPYPVEDGRLIFNESPKRVGSLSPALTEILFELGYGDRLVCRSSYCTYPAEAENIPSAGSGANPDFDTIIEIKPDLLLTQSPIANTDMRKLSDAGITVMTIPAPDSTEALFDTYRRLSLIFSGSVDGERLADEACGGLRSALAAASGSCDSLIFIMNVTDEGYYAAGSGTFAGSYISCFGRNAAADGALLTDEELIAADPQVIFLAHPLSISDISDEAAESLTAVSQGYVYVIDGSLLERPTSRLVTITDPIAEKVREETGGSSYTGGFAVIPDSVGDVPEDDESSAEEEDQTEDDDTEDVN